MTNTPNLFLIGAPKAGTSALAEQLGLHPDIYLNKKEPRYFDARTFYDYQEDALVTSEEQYLQLYNSNQARSSRYRLDASVFNMYDETSIEDILSLAPEAKFILVLRDPLEAAKSMHLQRLKYPDGPLREISESFTECWKSLGQRKNGLDFPRNCRNRFLFRYDLLFKYERYTPFINRLIPKDNLLYIDYSSFKNSPKDVRRAIFKFLKINYHEVPEFKANPTFIVPSQLGVFDYLRSIALPLVRKFPATRKCFSAAKRLVPQTRVYVKTKSTPIDEEVRSFFAESYLAMEQQCTKIRGTIDLNRQKNKWKNSPNA